MYNRRRAQLRFWSKVDVRSSDECWLWTACVNGDGYGSFYFCRKAVGAHIMVYLLLYGRIPRGKEVCHNCPGGDNPACVNPQHLFLGSHKQNMHDSIAKGTFVSVRTQRNYQAGEQHHMAKLTVADVLEIRRRCKAGEQQKDIAKDYGIIQQAVSNIRWRKCWKHV